MAVEHDPQAIIEDSLQNYIVNSIIPRMQDRRKRNGNLSTEQIIQKLEAPKGTGKQGEFREFEEQVRRQVDGLDGSFASEIADIVYYCSQPNCPKNEKDSMDFWFAFLGIPYKAAQEFCIVKYELRILYGDKPNIKDVENHALDIIIDEIYPELKTFWKNPMNN